MCLGLWHPVKPVTHTFPRFRITIFHLVSHALPLAHRSVDCDVLSPTSSPLPPPPSLYCFFLVSKRYFVRFALSQRAYRMNVDALPSGKKDQPVRPSTGSMCVFMRFPIFHREFLFSIFSSSSRRITLKVWIHRVSSRHSTRIFTDRISSTSARNSWRVLNRYDDNWQYNVQAETDSGKLYSHSYDYSDRINLQNRGFIYEVIMYLTLVCTIFLLSHINT